jgi:hypothetical protein
LIILPFIETVFHFLNRNLPQGMKVWPHGSFHINPFDYLKCGVSRRGINRSSHLKKQLLITTIMEVFSNIPMVSIGQKWLILTTGHHESLQPLQVQAREGCC